MDVISELNTVFSESHNPVADSALKSYGLEAVEHQSHAASHLNQEEHMLQDFFMVQSVFAESEIKAFFMF